jgi:hypothetical protein
MDIGEDRSHFIGRPVGKRGVIWIWERGDSEKRRAIASERSHHRRERELNNRGVSIAERTGGIGVT